MNIRLATNLDQSVWDDYVQHHPDSLAYHRYAWKLAVEESYRFKGFYLLVDSDEGVRGVLPLIKLERPIGSAQLVSLPYCDVGGVLCDSPDIEKKLLDAAMELAAKSRCGQLDIRSSRFLVNCQGSEQCQKVRMILALPGSSEELLLGLKSKLRSQVKKPVRDGLKAQLGGAELLKQFYVIFSENMRELGSPVHSLDWFKSVVNAYAGNARIGLVHTPEGRPAAAGIILFNESTVSVPWASALRRFNRFNPNMLLYWTFLSYAADNGYSSFDFGRSTVGEGTFKFKQQWGAQPKALSWIRYNQRGIKVKSDRGSSKTRSIAEECWRRMPLSMCNWIGPYVRRYISL